MAPPGASTEPSPGRGATDLGLLRDQRGAVTVEYTVVLGLVAVGASVAVIGLGALLLQLFQFQQAVLLLPFP